MEALGEAIKAGLGNIEEAIERIAPADMEDLSTVVKERLDNIHDALSRYEPPDPSISDHLEDIRDAIVAYVCTSSLDAHEAYLRIRTKRNPSCSSPFYAPNTGVDASEQRKRRKKARKTTN